VAALPAGANLTEIAFDLVDELERMCDRSDIIAIFKEGLLARKALTELGIQLS
jgi:hypothetical protein